ncbi:hydrogen gas-evolving membrane-bound hydrogenase subunit E [Thiocapsa bogorovii]|uniref:hydrogen gas-evolving membrane-bound hydrogenase subunit E n=1 Tax=Thiocapsa bogorovii TaxID=521689 RepID=UPI001E57885B|nr:hydrogen gas-evolving membrane-bound hydrogenase subunit E [Thiocapsa bogorovii]UHD15943.1 sodium:proton antiporter [Thiocapsa bogorovii]
MRNLASLLFAGGLAFLLLTLLSQLAFGTPPMRVGAEILAVAPGEVGAANLVTAILLGYRGFDTLGELAILFAAATAAGVVLGRRRDDARRDPPGGEVLRTGADLLFPLLVVVGFYVIAHGHLTPGGGFQGGVILAAAFFVALLAQPARHLSHGLILWIEGLAGAAFILIGIWALVADGDFLAPLLGPGRMGDLVSAGTLPLLSLAIGLKVGAELAGIMAHIADAEAPDT